MLITISCLSIQGSSLWSSEMLFPLNAFTHLCHTANNPSHAQHRKIASMLMKAWLTWGRIYIFQDILGSNGPILTNKGPLES